MSPLLEGRDQTELVHLHPNFSTAGTEHGGLHAKYLWHKTGPGCPLPVEAVAPLPGSLLSLGLEEEDSKRKAEAVSLSYQPHLASAHPDGFRDLGT